MQRIVAATFLISLSGASGFAQAKVPAEVQVLPSGFPAQLLDGMEDFAVALHFYADSRGNFGPCG